MKWRDKNMIIEFNEIKHKEYTFVLSKTIEMNVLSKYNMLSATNNDLKICVFADNIDELKEEFLSRFYYKWLEYTMINQILSDSDIQL